MAGMNDFQLPVVAAGTSLEDAFGRMIQQDVSGLVVDAGVQGFRLLHFAVVQNAVELQVERLENIPGGIQLEFGALDTNPSADYDLSAAFGIVATVRSRHENLSFTYMASSPGYVCTGPAHHSYPPRRRGSSNRCVVPGCLGTI
jgi:hypothetical protein